MNKRIKAALFVFITAGLLLWSLGVVVVQARWIRGGNDTYYEVVNTCQDGIEFTLAVNTGVPYQVDVTGTLLLSGDIILTDSFTLDAVPVYVPGIGNVPYSKHVTASWNTPLQPGSRVQVFVEIDPFGNGEQVPIYTFVQNCNLTDLPAAYETIIFSYPVEQSAGDQIVPVAPIAFSSHHISSTMQVDLHQPVGDLNLAMKLDHGLDNPISATLTSPAGTIVQLFNGESGGGSGFGNRCHLNNGNLLFDPLADFILDDHSAFQFGDVEVTAPFTATAVMPSEALNAFQGEDPAGTWTLDIYNGDPFPSTSLVCWYMQFEEVSLGCGNQAEAFEYGLPLAGTWLTQNSGPVFWDTTANVNACNNGINNTPGSGFAACADSDELNAGAAPYDAELWSNSFSLANTAEASLQFAAAYDDFSAVAGADTFDVDVSTDGGTSWANALRWNEDHAGEIASVNLNSYIGEDNVRVRFRYYSVNGGWDWWVHVDDVEVICGDPSAELALTKSDTLDPAIAGESLTYNLTVTNNGPSVGNSITITDTLPADVSFLSASPSQGSCMETAGVVTCGLGDLTAGLDATVQIIVDVDPAAIGIITNTAVVSAINSDPNDANNIASETTTINAEADLAITKLDDPDPVVAGEVLTYTLSVTNGGPSDTSGVTVVDSLPADFTFLSSSPGTPTCNKSGGALTCNLGDLTSGANSSVTIVGTVDAAALGTLSNTANASSNETDPDVSNNTVIADTTIAVQTDADLAITKIDDPDPVVAGELLTYTLTVVNNGPATASGVTVSDTLPAGVLFLSSAPGSPTCAHTGGIVTCNLGALDKSASSEVIIVGLVDPSVQDSLSNTASVAANEVDPNLDNNADTEVTSVVTPADYRLYLPTIIRTGTSSVQTHEVGASDSGTASRWLFANPHIFW